ERWPRLSDPALPDLRSASSGRVVYGGAEPSSLKTGGGDDGGWKRGGASNVWRHSVRDRGHLTSDRPMQVPGRRRSRLQTISRGVGGRGNSPAAIRTV